jgi:hypothetical protein
VQLEELKCIENKRNEWLKKKETEWRHKSWALWLQDGDNNTKKNHHFANHRKKLNTIWEIKNEEDVLVSSFREKVESGVRFFENIFQSPRRFPIQEILEVVTKF